METDTLFGPKMIKVSDEVHVLSQLESCIRRGEKIDCLTPIEFECIVDVKKSNEKDEECDMQKR